MISKLMDIVERAVKAQASIDKQVEIAEKQIAMQEAIEKTKLQQEMLRAQAQAYQAQMANVYNPYTNQQGIQSVGINSNAGTALGGTYTVQAGTGAYTTTGGLGGNAWTVPVAPGTYTVQVQLPSGQAHDVTIVDADGKEHVIKVDVSYLSWINDINYGHRSIIAQRPKALPDPEFDLDEMEKASEILEGLDGTHP